MRLLATKQQWPPGYLDEVSALLVRVPYPHMKPTRPSDSEYGPIAAIAEAEAWLDLGPQDGQTRSDCRSFTADLSRALSWFGPSVTSRTPSASALKCALETVVSNWPRFDREDVRASLSALHVELSDPETAVAAFDDLLDVVSDPHNSHSNVTARLATLTQILELSDRASAEVCAILGGILDDQALEISIARHGLDGTPIAKLDRPDKFAGLAEVERVQLSHRYLMRPGQDGHHVVWVAYDHARVAVAGSWRQRVGMVEFFDGPTLVDMLSQPKSTPYDPPLPDELLTPLALGDGEIDVWPPPEQHKHWVAARVDLGTGTFSNPIRTGREQADALVELAIFENGGSTWTPLAGILHLVDNVHHSSERFGTPNEIQHRVSVNSDTTAAEFPKIATSIGGRLPIVDLTLRRLLTEIRALNASTKSGELDLLAREVMVIEAVTRLNEERPSNWPQFLKKNLADFQAHKQAIHDIYDAVANVLDVFQFKDAPHLTREIREPLPDGRTLFKRKAALELVPQLVPELPEHDSAARRLRDIARRTESPTDLQAWVDELAADCRIKIDRAERVRNGLTHAGAAPREVLATIRLRFNWYARLVAGAALQAVIAGTPVKDAFDAHRTGNRRWRQRIADAVDTSDALFDPETP